MEPYCSTTNTSMPVRVTIVIGGPRSWSLELTRLVLVSEALFDIVWCIERLPRLGVCAVVKRHFFSAWRGVAVVRCSSGRHWSLLAHVWNSMG